MKVLLVKPSVDNRDGATIVRSRIGLKAEAITVPAELNLYDLYLNGHKDCNVIIVDECQFLHPDQVDQLSQLVMDYDVPVLCFGLSTDFLTHLFPGSRRLFEIADSIQEIKSVCKCGGKATVNARLDDNGNVVFSGDQVCIGGNERYVAMCKKCWLKAKREQEAKGIYT